MVCIHTSMNKLIVGGLTGIIVFAGTSAFAQTVATPQASPQAATAPFSPSPSPQASVSCAPNSIACLSIQIANLTNRIAALEQRVAAIAGGKTTAAPAHGGTQAGAIEQGSSGQSVQTVQQFLKAEGSFTYPTATGYYGSATTNAVKVFQAKNGLAPTGVVDQPTLQKMNTMVQQVAPTLKASVQSMTTQIAPTQ